MALKAQLFDAEILPEDREGILQTNCETVQHDFAYTIPLTEDELTVRREQKVQADIKLAELATEKQVFLDAHKLKVLPVSVKSATLLDTVRRRHEDRKTTVYVYRDDETGMVGMYDPMGNLISSRRMTPEEKQGNIFSQTTVSSPE